jgi:nucleotide-binding universal stress UspA family protein
MTILVPTDFSKSAQNAVSYATAFAKETNAKLILLHAFRIVYPASDVHGELVIEEISVTQKKANEKLDKLCQDIVKKSKVKCDYLCKEGFAMDVILETSKKINPDFIIMGTKGASGLKGVVFGSNTATVIEKARHPVIAVPDGAEFKKIKKITYATNYYASELYAIKKLAEIALPFNATINILHVADGEFISETESEILKQFVQKVSKKIKYNKFSYQLIFGGSVEKGLNSYLKKQPSDLLAMSTQHRNLLEKWFGKSITKKMAYQSDVPLLAFHHKKESVIFI